MYLSMHSSEETIHTGPQSVQRDLEQCRQLNEAEAWKWWREGYAEYVKQWENAIAKCSRVLAGLEHNLGYPGG
ncbi:hypothetical protein BDE02_18G118600 [Populus trichocarpa]|nr:hypothetical protein BDE02_18G118600 [Populus trichocarpa]